MTPAISMITPFEAGMTATIALGGLATSCAWRDRDPNLGKVGRLQSLGITIAHDRAITALGMLGVRLAAIRTNEHDGGCFRVAPSATRSPYAEALNLSRPM